MCQIHPQAKPFTLTGNRPEHFLLIHGFTSSPSELRPLGELLNREGYSVRAPLLPGHGTEPEDLRQTTWHDWYRRVEETALEILISQAPLFVAGLSLGGLLALKLAAEHSEMAGVIVINAPVVMRTRRGGWTSGSGVYRKFIPKRLDKNDIEMEERGRFAYDCYPVDAMLSVDELRKSILNVAREVNVPALVVQAGEDEIVDPRGANMLQRRLPKAERDILYLPQSRHVATMGPEVSCIAEKICAFAKK